MRGTPHTHNSSGESRNGSANDAVGASKIAVELAEDGSPHARISRVLDQISAPFLAVSAAFTGVTHIKKEIHRRSIAQQHLMQSHIELLSPTPEESPAITLPYEASYQSTFTHPQTHDIIFTSGPQEWNEHWSLLNVSAEGRWGDVFTELSEALRVQGQSTPWHDKPGKHFKPVLMQIYNYITTYFLDNNHVSFNNKNKKKLKSFITRSTAELKQLPIYDLNPLFQWLQKCGLSSDSSAKMCVRILFSMCYLAHEAHVAHHFSESSQNPPLLQVTYLGSDNDTPRKILAGVLQWTLGYDDDTTSKIARSLRKIVSNDLQPRKGNAKRLQVISTDAATLANAAAARILQHPDHLQSDAFNEITSSLRNLLIKTLSGMLMLPSPQHDETQKRIFTNGLDNLSDVLAVWKKSNGKGNKVKNQALAQVLGLLSDSIELNIDEVQRQINLSDEEVKKLRLLSEALTPKFSSQYAGNQFIHNKFIPALLGNEKIQLFSDKTEARCSLRDEIVLEIQLRIVDAYNRDNFHKFMTQLNPALISWIFQHETDETLNIPLAVTFLSRDLIVRKMVAKLEASKDVLTPTTNVVLDTIRFCLRYTNSVDSSPRKKQAKGRGEIWQVLANVQETFADEIPENCFLVKWNKKNLFPQLCNSFLNNIEPLVFPAICEYLAHSTCIDRQQESAHSLIKYFTDVELVQLLLHTLNRSSEKHKQVEQAMLRCVDMTEKSQKGKNLIHNIDFLINLQTLQSTTAFKCVNPEDLSPPSSLLEILFLNHGKSDHKLLTPEFFVKFSQKIASSMTMLLEKLLERRFIPAGSEEEVFCTNLLRRTEKHTRVSNEDIRDICTKHLAKKLFEFQQDQASPLYIHFDRYCSRHPSFHLIIKGTHNFISAIRDGIDKYQDKAASLSRGGEKKSSDSAEKIVRNQVAKATKQFLHLVLEDLGVITAEEGTASPWQLPFLYAQYHDQEFTDTVQHLVCDFLEKLPAQYSKFKIEPPQDKEEQVLIRAAIKLNKMHAASKAITNRGDGRNPQEAAFHPASAAIFKKVLSSKRSSSPSSPTSPICDLPQEAFLLSQALIVLLHQQMGNLNPQITSLIFAVASSEYCPGRQPAKYCIRERDVIRISQAYLTETKSSPRHTQKQGFFSVIMAPPAQISSSRLTTGSKSPSL